MLTKLKLFLAFLITSTSVSFAQNITTLDYSDKKEYTIADVKVSGVQFLDSKILISMSGLSIGRKIKIPGEDITKVIDKFWTQGLFSDVKIYADKIEGDQIWLTIYLKERPRLSKFVITGIKKSDATELTEKLKIKPGIQVTDNSNQLIINTIKHHYKEKGFFNTKVTLTEKSDTINKNKVLLTATVVKGDKVRIKTIDFIGNVKYSDRKLHHVLKKTREVSLNIFKPSKFIEKEYIEDKKKLQDFYSKNGYRDFNIDSDSIVQIAPNRINLFIKIHEGKQFHIRKISFIGNTKYPSSILARAIILKKGDVYDRITLNKKLNDDEESLRNSFYSDNGYLFSSVTPIEAKIDNDSIDLEIHIVEGPQATINRITIAGNTKTNENVVRRELFTKPGDLFSRADIVTSVRRLAQLGNFDAEKIDPQVQPNQADGTVDIKFNLVEKANDQLEISGGWGYNSLVGTVGLKFNNFASSDIFNPKAWRPVPSGDGQSLSLRVQSNGSWMRSISMSFVDPWFGGKKPNTFSFSLQNQVYDYSKNIANVLGGKNGSTQRFSLFSASIGLGRRLKWPDDNFTLSNDFSYQHYSLRDWKDQWFTFTNGTSNTVTFGTTFSRNTIDNPQYPRNGSLFSIGLQITPPFSLFRKANFWQLSPSEVQFYGPDPNNIYLAEQAKKYQLIEYHKWSFRGSWVNSIVGNLVFSFNSQFGYLGYFNKYLGYSPFEGYVLGGSGMSWNAMGGREIVGLRGYADYTVTPNTQILKYRDANNNPVFSTTQIANIYTKMTMELRYPISLQPQALIYALVFTEGGNSWYHFQDLNPFALKRSAGIGLRAFLPMIGSIGVDWGYGFDAIPGNPSANKGQFHFTMGQQF